MKLISKRIAVFLALFAAIAFMFGATATPAMACKPKNNVAPPATVVRVTKTDNAGEPLKGAKLPDHLQWSGGCGMGVRW